MDGSRGPSGSPRGLGSPMKIVWSRSPGSARRARPSASASAVAIASSSPPSAWAPSDEVVDPGERRALEALGPPCRKWSGSQASSPIHQVVLALADQVVEDHEVGDQDLVHPPESPGSVQIVLAGPASMCRSRWTARPSQVDPLARALQEVGDPAIGRVSSISDPVSWRRASAMPGHGARGRDRLGEDRCRAASAAVARARDARPDADRSLPPGCRRAHGSGQPAHVPAAHGRSPRR